ncbi:MAG: PAS domain S-box protein, partial [Gammaproteobacteria bacterium]
YIDLLNEIAKHEGWRLQFVAGTWPEVYRKTLKGEIDILTSIAHAEERRPYFDFTTIPVEIGYGRLAVREHSELNSLSELDNIRVGLIRDDINGLELKKKTKELGVAPIWVYYDNYTEMLRALSKGEIEVAAINNLYSRFELDTFGLKYAAPFYAPVMLTFAAAKGKHSDLLNTIDKYMARWKDDPDSIYYSAREKWLRAHLRPWLPVWVKPVVTILAAVFLLSVLWLLTLRRKIRQRTAELVATQQQLQQSVNALSELQARLKAIIHALPDGLVTFNTDGHITGCYGTIPNGLPTPQLGTHLVEAFAPDLSALLLNEAEAALKAGTSRAFTTKLQTGETTRHYEFRLCPYEPAPDASALLMMVRDISALEFLRDSAQSINARFAAFAEAMPDLGFILTRTGDYVLAFGGRVDLFVRPPDELTGKNIRDVLPKPICERLLQSIEQAITTSLTACVEYSLEVPAGLRHFEAQIAPIKGQNNVDEVALISRDITHRIEAEEAIRQLAFYDAVTELPNRKLFMDR